MSKRTSTSYTVLGLLALGPKTGYELVQGYERSIGQISSRSDAVLYEMPKRLVKDGFASSVDQQRGKRTVAVYSITDAGTDELHQWLSRPSSFPLLEAEPVVRTIFSDFSEPDDLRKTIVAFRDEAAARLAVLADMGEEYLERDGLYQERFHLTMLTGKFVAYLMGAYVEWCDWALAGLDQWPDDLEGRHSWAEQAMAEWLRDVGRIPADAS